MPSFGAAIGEVTSDEESENPESAPARSPLYLFEKEFGSATQLLVEPGGRKARL